MNEGNEPQNGNEPQGNTQEQPSGEIPKNQRIQELFDSLDKARTAFITQGKDIEQQLLIWGTICFLLIVFSNVLFRHFLDITFPAQYWTWQYVYYTAIRITAISALFYVAAFVFNMLKSTISLYQSNKRKIVIIDSMASFVESGITAEDRSIIFNKLIGIVIDSDIIHRENKDLDKVRTTADILAELIEKLKK